MSETTKRLISAIVIGVGFLFIFLYRDIFYLQLYFFALFIFFTGSREFYQFSVREDSRPFRLTGYIFGAIIISIYYLQFLSQQSRVPAPESLRTIGSFLDTPGLDSIAGTFVFFFIVTWFLQITTRQLDGAIFSVTSTIAGVLYCGVTIAHFFFLLVFPFGEFYVFFVCLVTIMCDAGAYFAGRWFGSHPAGLKISPKKTWEGYAGGILTSIAFGLLTILAFEKFTNTKMPISYFEGAILALVLAIISIVGDLAESSMKRDAKIKDSGGIIPGHGGVLDLADALIFTIPTLYYYIKFKSLLGFAV